MSSTTKAELATRAALSPEGDPDQLVLLVLTGKARGQRVSVGDKLRIGKAPDNDLVLSDDTVSRHHCELERGDGGLVVRDLDSTNYTRVGRTKVREATLGPGATLTVGDVDLVLRTEPNRTHILPSESDQFGDALGPSLAMRTLFGLLEHIAPTDAPVLLEGETGTGKDVLARSIHQTSPRTKEPFIVVDCGALSYNLLESELFGHERGAFTGAVAQRQGAFESAGMGTVFLDEVGELPLDVQPKLLRVLETGEFRRVGGNKLMRAHARVVAATKRNLKEEVERGKFREDLYFRLAVVPITVPPLRQRREEIPALIEYFLQLAKERDPAAADVIISPDTIAGLSAHDWPGNVRELRNVLDRALYIATASGARELRLVDLPVGASLTRTGVTGPFEPTKTYREVKADFEAEFERAYVHWLLSRHSGNVSAAAREAKMDRKYLSDLAKRHGLRD